jgi:hypothetical protein
MSSDDDFNVGYHVVCIIDVLGQKNKLAQWAKIPADGQPTSEFVNALKQTVGTILVFKKIFLDYFDIFHQGRIPDKLAVLPLEQQEKCRRGMDSKVNIEQFSDTFVFYSLIKNAHGDVSVMPIFQTMAACCMAMTLSLAAKSPVRGAITIGTGTELEDHNNFYGPALAEAHYLESEIAGYPRVIVSDKVREFLADRQTHSNDWEIAEIMKLMASSSRSLLCQDVDGRWIVDFLGQGNRDIVEQDKECLAAVPKAYKFVRREAIRFREESNTKLALRYYLLQQYIESRLPIWGIETKT